MVDSAHAIDHLDSPLRTDGLRCQVAGRVDRDGLQRATRQLAQAIGICVGHYEAEPRARRAGKEQLE